MRVGGAEDLDVWSLTGERPVFTAGAAPPRVRWNARCRCAHGGVAPAVAEVRGGRLEVTLREPLRGGCGRPDAGALPARPGR